MLRLLVCCFVWVVGVGAIGVLLIGCDEGDADGKYPVRPIKIVVPLAPGGGSGMRF